LVEAVPARKPLVVGWRRTIWYLTSFRKKRPLLGGASPCFAKIKNSRIEPRRILFACLQGKEQNIEEKWDAHGKNLSYRVIGYPRARASDDGFRHILCYPPWQSWNGSDIKFFTALFSRVCAGPLAPANLRGPQYRFLASDERLDGSHRLA